MAFAEEISISLDKGIHTSVIQELLEKPKDMNKGDIAFPCFRLANRLKTSPVTIASEIASKFQHPLFEKVVADGPYVNGFFNKEVVGQTILKEILRKEANYGSKTLDKEQRIVIDFSSPNIAKPFSMGHLRSTVIGHSLGNIVEKCGYKAVRINHLGDWGTQFGKLIVAYKRWGNHEIIEKNPIKELLKLYVRFHDEAESNKELVKEARIWFKKLEDGNEEAKQLWQWFRDESLKEFSKIYTLLNIQFDSFNGEAFYNDKMEQTIINLQQKNLLKTSEGAEVVNLEEYGLPPCLIRKSDGATLYATRDLTAAIYRYEKEPFAKTLYVVGHEQSLHFKQIFLVLEKLGYSFANTLVHVPFGFILKNGKKMSTRKGRVVLLDEVLNEAIQLAKKNIEEKNPSLSNKDEIAKMVGVGAIIFHDLKNERQNNFEFCLEDMLKFEGNTGPYIQYTHARACSILRKAQQTIQVDKLSGLNDKRSWFVIKLLMEFPTVIERSFTLNEPSQIAKYVIDLSQEFNKFYNNVKILSTDYNKLNDKLALVKAVTIVLNEGLRLLGIKAPSEM